MSSDHLRMWKSDVGMRQCMQTTGTVTLSEVLIEL